MAARRSAAVILERVLVCVIGLTVLTD
jgi:hypothetical protein